MLDSWLANLKICGNYLKFEINRSECSRKNFVFLFGALINLTVRVDAYFHPIRMTYPIQPGPFFRAAPNWGKLAKHSLRSFRTGQTYSLSALFNSSRIKTQ